MMNSTTFHKFFEFNKINDPTTRSFSLFEHHDTLLNEGRCLGLQADVHASQNISKVPTLRMLKQAVNVYTPVVLKCFKVSLRCTWTSIY